jgi:hypothetical protein
MNKKMFVELSKVVDERVEMVIEKFNTAIEEYESNGATEQYVYLRDVARKELLISLIGNEKVLDALKEDYDKILNGVTIFTMFKTVRMLKWIAKTYNYCLASNEVLLETARENDMIDEDEMKVNANGYEFNE